MWHVQSRVDVLVHPVLNLWRPVLLLDGETAQKPPMMNDEVRKAASVDFFCNSGMTFDRNGWIAMGILMALSACHYTCKCIITLVTFKIASSPVVAWAPAIGGGSCSGRQQQLQNWAAGSATVL